MFGGMEIKVLEKVLEKVIKGEDYRSDVISVISANFLEFTIKFFKKIVEAKLKGEEIGVDWYKNYFLNTNLPKEEIAINAGINIKTINNIYGTTKKEIVIEAAEKNYEYLLAMIENLVNSEGVEVTLTLKFRGISVDLNVSESLIVINTLAVKRSQIRGSVWSLLGKRLEAPLMISLCKLFGVDKKYYEAKFVRDKSKSVDREVDFYLVNREGKKFRCEVKLMGKGNPESADAVFPRGSKVFIADTLSEQNKSQLEQEGILWVELRRGEGYRRFKKVLKSLKIPFKEKEVLSVKDAVKQAFKEIYS
jgi:hypothetical protein